MLLLSFCMIFFILSYSAPLTSGFPFIDSNFSLFNSTCLCNSTTLFAAIILYLSNKLLKESKMSVKILNFGDNVPDISSVSCLQILLVVSRCFLIILKLLLMSNMVSFCCTGYSFGVTSLKLSTSVSKKFLSCTICMILFSCLSKRSVILYHNSIEVSMQDAAWFHCSANSFFHIFINSCDIFLSANSFEVS
ncbi:hypothetical protein AWRI1631_131400 [Saccharomyces cerevisiae AWRI1631]|uniref:Uncharacterized protein n=1 Tax=Saccharomyces cerevisiae (strain AWRI1631) TaxID=545124 RepID=B5VPC8_YEAS6|nr:hypothetical protein AWRI1631_131400 [Saccharomyces cerevisiae AWRI1631]